MVTIRRQDGRRIVNLFETSSHSRHSSSPSALVLLRTISLERKITNSHFQDYTNSLFQDYKPSRKITESPFQDSSILPLSHMVHPQAYYIYIRFVMSRVEGISNPYGKLHFENLIKIRKLNKENVGEFGHYL